MPWSKIKGGGTCSEEEWAVVNDDSGETEGCHATEAEADAQLAALNASEDEGDMAVLDEQGVALPSRWDASFAFLSPQRTDDGREFSEIGWRDPPLTLKWQKEDQPGHMSAVGVGQVESFRIEGDTVFANGSFDLASVDGREVARRVRDKIERGISIDFAPVSLEVIEEGDCSEEGWMSGLCHVVERYRANILSATVVRDGAFSGAVIAPEGQLEAVTHASELVASCADCEDMFPTADPPPLSWFENPGFTEATPITITDDGRVFGHLAESWEACHIGYSGRCVQPPRNCDASIFMTGCVHTAEGVVVATGRLTIGDGHAKTELDWASARKHYDDSAWAVCDVVYGEDDIAPWIAGYVRPGTARAKVIAMRASPPSGDWRYVDGRVRLIGAPSKGLDPIAAHGVNVPGFPVPRPARVLAAAAYFEDGETVKTLILPSPKPKTSDEAKALRIAVDASKRLARLERAMRDLGPTRAAALRTRLNGDVMLDNLNDSLSSR